MEVAAEVAVEVTETTTVDGTMITMVSLWLEPEKAVVVEEDGVVEVAIMVVTTLVTTVALVTILALVDLLVTMVVTTHQDTEAVADELHFRF